MSLLALVNKLTEEGYTSTTTGESLEKAIVLFKSNNTSNKRIELIINNSAVPSFLESLNNPTITITSISASFCLNKNLFSISCDGATYMVKITDDLDYGRITIEPELT